MAIDPKLVSIISASDLPTGDPTSAGQFFFFEGAEMKKAPMTNIYDKVSVGINLGLLTPTSAAAPETGIHRGQAIEAGTYTNFSGIIVTAADLDIVSGVSNNRVILTVNNGVVSKWVERVKGEAGEAGVVNYNTTTLNPTAIDKAETGKTVSEYFTNSSSVVKTTSLVAKYIDANGAFQEGGANWRTDAFFIPVKEGEEYEFTGSNAIGAGTVKSVAGYNASNVFVSILVPHGDYTVTPAKFTIPAGIASIRSSAHVNTPPQLTLLKKIIKDKFIEVNSAAKISINKTWASVGTSITWQDGVQLGYTGTPTGALGIAKGYQTRIREVFSFAGYSNYGYSGYSLAGTTAGDTQSIVNVAGWVSHDIFSLESITNDFKRNIPIGTITDYNNATGITTYYGALRAFKDKVLALNASATIIVANALKRNNGGYTSTSANTAGHTLLDYEKALMVIARLNDWRFIDQNRESGIIDETLSQTTMDGLHPNDFGYRLISKVWIREFWMLSKTI